MKDELLVALLDKKICPYLNTYLLQAVPTFAIENNISPMLATAAFARGMLFYASMGLCAAYERDADTDDLAEELQKTVAKFFHTRTAAEQALLN